MMWSQLRTGMAVGRLRDDSDAIYGSNASCPYPDADIHRRILLRIRGKRLAVAQASCTRQDVRALYCGIARHHVWPCPQGVLIRPSSDAATVRLVSRGKQMAGILLAKFLDGDLASFVRSEGEFFVVSVNGEERTISREIWRLLPEQQIREQDRVHHPDHRRDRGLV